MEKSHTGHHHSKTELFTWRTALVALFVLLIFALYKTPVPKPEPTVDATFAGVSLTLDYATTTVERARGLGGRVGLASGEAMLFAFAKDDTYGFWMKDMDFPIDIFWLDDKGRVVSSAVEVGPDTYPHVFYPSVPARYVLETAAGFAHRYQVATGTPLLLNKFPTVSK